MHVDYPSDSPLLYVGDRKFRKEKNICYSQSMFQAFFENLLW